MEGYESKMGDDESTLVIEALSLRDAVKVEVMV